MHDRDLPGGPPELIIPSFSQNRNAWPSVGNATRSRNDLRSGPLRDHSGRRLFPGHLHSEIRCGRIEVPRRVGVPHFTPHDLRLRRVSLVHRQGLTWAEIGALRRPAKLSVTADTYTQAMAGGRRGRYAALLAA